MTTPVRRNQLACELCEAGYGPILETDFPKPIADQKSNRCFQIDAFKTMLSKRCFQNDAFKSMWPDEEAAKVTQKNGGRARNLIAGRDPSPFCDVRFFHRNGTRIFIGFAANFNGLIDCKKSQLSAIPAGHLVTRVS